LVTFAAAALMIGCGDTPPAEPPPQPTAAPADTGSAAPTTAAEPPPAPTATADATPPPPPAKPAKDKFAGKWTQDFSGEVAAAAQETAAKAGGKTKDQKKIDAALEKSKKAFTDLGATIEVTGTTIAWTIKGKNAHTITIDAPKGDDPTNLALKFQKDGKKDLKGLDVTVTFKDDKTFEMKDPFAKKPMVLVFKQ
jgi:plastocyanin